MAASPTRSSRFLRQLLPVCACTLALAGCLQRVAIPAPAPATPLVATIPAGFFVATPPPPTVIPTLPFFGRYRLIATEALRPGDARARYAVPLLDRDTHFVQITLLITDLREPRTPSFAYELVTEAGVFGALASGEWEEASATGATYRQEGVLLFVVPLRLREARLEVVEYAYERTASGAPTALERVVIASFELPSLP